jgi:hypothetical protein
MMPTPRPILDRIPGEYSICRLPPGAIPGWATQGAFVSITRTPSELSVVCESGAVPVGVTADGPWHALAVRGPLDLSMTGVLAALAVPLADASVSLFAVSTYDTDYVLVRASQTQRATQALRDDGYTIADGIDVE